MTRSSRAASIPAFALYGEAGALPADQLHLEAIQSRSRLYRWEIDAHIHQGLHQIVWVASGPARVALETMRESCEGPVAIVVPPGMVHAFRFTQETDGLVLTFHPRAVRSGASRRAQSRAKNFSWSEPTQLSAPLSRPPWPGSMTMVRLASGTRYTASISA